MVTVVYTSKAYFYRSASIQNAYVYPCVPSWDSMFARTAVAVLDPNATCGREQKEGRDGDPAFTVKVSVQYHCALQCQALHRRCSGAHIIDTVKSLLKCPSVCYSHSSPSATVTMTI
jgi:hypothetical protein